jgi:putative transposase
MPSEMRRLRQIEDENAKLKKLVADLSLDKAMLQDVLAKNSEACEATSARRRGPSHLEGQHSTDVAQVLRAERSSCHDKARRRSQAALAARIKEIAETRVRYGYRRVHVLLRREGWEINAKRVYRLYKELGLQLRNSEA